MPACLPPCLPACFAHLRSDRRCIRFRCAERVWPLRGAMPSCAAAKTAAFRTCQPRYADTVFSERTERASEPQARQAPQPIRAVVWCGVPLSLSPSLTRPPARPPARPYLPRLDPCSRIRLAQRAYTSQLLPEQRPPHARCAELLDCLPTHPATQPASQPASQPDVSVKAARVAHSSAAHIRTE